MNGLSGKQVDRSVHLWLPSQHYYYDYDFYLNRIHLILVRLWLHYLPGNQTIFRIQNCNFSTRYYVLTFILSSCSLIILLGFGFRLSLQTSLLMPNFNWFGAVSISKLKFGMGLTIVAVIPSGCILPSSTFSLELAMVVFILVCWLFGWLSNIVGSAAFLRYTLLVYSLRSM